MFWRATRNEFWVLQTEFLWYITSFMRINVIQQSMWTNSTVMNASLRNAVYGRQSSLSAGNITASAMTIMLGWIVRWYLIHSSLYSTSEWESSSNIFGTSRIGINRPQMDIWTIRNVSLPGSGHGTQANFDGRGTSPKPSKQLFRFEIADASSDR